MYVRLVHAKDKTRKAKEVVMLDTRGIVNFSLNIPISNRDPVFFKFLLRFVENFKFKESNSSPMKNFLLLLLL